MKKAILSIRGKIALICVLLLSGMSAFAQDVSGNSTTPKGKMEMGTVFPYLLFGIVIVFLGYVSYRYWKDNRTT